MTTLIRITHAILTAAAVIVGVWSLGAVTGANMAMWLIGFAILLALLAMMAQASARGRG